MKFKQKIYSFSQGPERNIKVEGMTVLGYEVIVLHSHTLSGISAIPACHVRQGNEKVFMHLQGQKRSLDFIFTFSGSEYE